MTQTRISPRRWRFSEGRGREFRFGEVNLGSLYFNGQGVARDDKEAAKWDRLAADQGLAPAQANLGLMYIHGQGVGIDYVEGQRLLRLASDQNFAPALNALGDLFAEGTTVDQDYIEAAKLYRLAASEALRRRRPILAHSTPNGEGVARNYVEAMRWYGLAADQGYSGVQASLDPPAGAAASNREQTSPSGEPKPSHPAFPLKPAPNARYSKAPPEPDIPRPNHRQTFGQQGLRRRADGRDRSLPDLPGFLDGEFRGQQGRLPGYVEDPSALLAKGPGGAAPSSSQNAEAQREFAKISLTRPPFDPPIVAALGQYMTFYVDPSVCEVREVEVLVNGFEWTWTPG